MSQRSRSSRVRQHVHCDSCYSQRCRARVEASVCCALVPCRLLCGAVFHLCKEEDHLLLCPNVRVPCINAAFGCSLQMCRSSRAQHLQACPASVVSCSMEWLRWPADDTNPHSFKALQENVLKENKGEEEALDLALALVDQANLYTRLKMKPLYPELMDSDEVEEETKEEKKEEAAVEIVDDSVPTIPQNHGVYGNAATQETVRMDAKQSLAHIKEKCSLTEMMFGMDRGGCEQACKQDGAKPNARAGASRTDSKDEERRGGREDPGKGEAAGGNAPPPDTTKCGHAPWQEGVLERLGQDLTPQEYNMYVVHHGRMLIAFGQIEACTPREKDFVYGSLEPIPVQTLRSFKVPDSYHYRRRVHLYDTASRAQSETRSVDTSDLNVEEEDCFGDEAASTLLGYAEIEVMGHRISESKAADGLYIDVGTQTHSFRAAPFKAKTTLAEVMTDRPLKLHLQLQAESVSGRHNRNSCAFSFVCGQAFHRKEFATHVRNVHSDIQTCLSGWFEQRCPLSYLGCTYTQRRFRPSTQNATVTYNQQLRCFNLRPVAEPSSGNDSATGGRDDEEYDPLSSLPYEVLCHMAGFLDSLSLSQLALVSRLMRQVCSTQLQERGMVTLQWERKTYSHGGVKWRAKPVWEFSHLFSSVDSWRMSDTPPISAHLKVCPFYQASPIGQPVPLLNLTQKEGCSKETPTLVNHFKQTTAMKQSH